jgi:hypothetical protein
LGSSTLPWMSVSGHVMALQAVKWEINLADARHMPLPPAWLYVMMGTLSIVRDAIHYVLYLPLYMR